MNELEIAILKDNIIKYLSARNQKKESLEAAYISLKIEKIPIEVVRGYAEEMGKDTVISCSKISSDRTLLILRPFGEAFLYEGGYVKRLEDELENKRQQDDDIYRNRVKTKLEIKNLKWGWWFSIAAIIISIVAFLVSIFKE